MLRYLMKSELAFYKNVLIGISIFTLLFLILNVAISHFLDVTLRALIFTLPVMGLFMRQDERRGQKHRMFMLLPVLTWHVAVIRHFVWLTFWSTAFGLLILTTYMSGHGTIEGDSYWLVLIIMNSMLIFVLSTSIVDNLFTFPAGRKKSTILTVVLVFAAVTCYMLLTFSQPVILFLRQVLVHARGALILSAVSVLLFCLQLITFVKRRSFL